jgi:hypothetical protein
LVDEIAKVTERLIIINSGRMILEAGSDEEDEKAYMLSGSAKTVLPLLDGLNCIGKTTAGSGQGNGTALRRISRSLPLSPSRFPTNVDCLR